MSVTKKEYGLVVKVLQTKRNVKWIMYARKIFDEDVQRSTRFYLYNMQSELLSECNNVMLTDFGSPLVK